MSNVYWMGRCGLASYLLISFGQQNRSKLGGLKAVI
jgi:hypothetical protein